MIKSFLISLLIAISPTQELLEQEEPITVEDVPEVTFDELSFEQKFDYVSELESYARSLRVALSARQSDYQRAVDNQMPEETLAVVMFLHDTNIATIVSSTPSMRATVARYWEAERLEQE